MIRLKNIQKCYETRAGKNYVLRQINLDIEEGEFITIMGPSAAGKTTLLNILGMLDGAWEGEYYLYEHAVHTLKPKERLVLNKQYIGFVFQNFNLLPRISALENVMLPLSYTMEHVTDREVRRRAMELINRVGLGDRYHHEPSQLSGGQQQRVAIARALINRPALLLADEPTGNLDSHTSEEVLSMFEQLNREEGITIILVTHDPNVARHARRTIGITDGVIVDGPSMQTLHQAGKHAGAAGGPMAVL